MRSAVSAVSTPIRRASCDRAGLHFLTDRRCAPAGAGTAADRPPGNVTGIARGILFLASDDAALMTGSGLATDGGLPLSGYALTPAAIVDLIAFLPSPVLPIVQVAARRISEGLGRRCVCGPALACEIGSSSGRRAAGRGFCSFTPQPRRPADAGDTNRHQRPGRGLRGSHRRRRQRDAVDQRNRRGTTRRSDSQERK